MPINRPKIGLVLTKISQVPVLFNMQTWPFYAWEMCFCVLSGVELEDLIKQAQVWRLSTEVVKIAISLIIHATLAGFTQCQLKIGLTQHTRIDTVYKSWKCEIDSASASGDIFVERCIALVSRKSEFCKIICRDFTFTSPGSKARRWKQPNFCLTERLACGLTWNSKQEYQSASGIQSSPKFPRPQGPRPSINIGELSNFRTLYILN